MFSLFIAFTAAVPRPPTPMHATFSLLLGDVPAWLRITCGNAAMAEASAVVLMKSRREEGGVISER
jgi:hypothetical protein